MLAVCVGGWVGGWAWWGWVGGRGGVLRWFGAGSIKGRGGEVRTTKREAKVLGAWSWNCGGGFG